MIEITAFPTIDLVRTGKRIEAIRKDRGLSVRDIQAFFGFEYPQAVYKWQHGECLPSVDNLFALAHLLRVGMEDLLVLSGSEDREVPVFLSGLSVQNQKSRQPMPIPPIGGLPAFLFCGHRPFSRVPSGSPG